MRVRSHWLKQALATDTAVAATLAGEERADVVIVGGGFCGLWTALTIKEREPSRDVVVIERDICGGGASGRNAGYVINLWAKFPTLLEMMPSDEAVRVARAAADAVGEIAAFCERHAIDAALRRPGWLWGATCAGQAEGFDDALETLARHQLAPFERLTGREIAERWGIEGHVDGVLEPSCMLVQPAKLVRGLRRVALDNGVRIFENSPMTRLERRSPARVVTEKGAVTADKAVIAMNAWAAALPELRRAFVVTAAEAAVTPPMPERLADLGFADAPGTTDSRVMIANYRPTIDGRVEFGKGGGGLAFAGRVGDFFEGHAHRLAAMRENLAQGIPALADVEIEHSWCGPIDRNWTGVPMAGPLPGCANIFFCVGFSGNGVGPSRLMGKVLASLVLEHDDEWSSSGLVRQPTPDFPPEPIRYVGGALVRRAVDRVDRLRQKGRVADPVTRWFADQGPAGMVTKAKRGA